MALIAPMGTPQLSIHATRPTGASKANSAISAFFILTSHYEYQRIMSIEHVSDDSFATQVLQSDRPVLVDFWAEWCGPCKMIAPILEQIATEYGDRLTVAKVDVEASQSTAMKYGIRSIPTLMLFKGGVVEAQHVGMLSKEQLSTLLQAKL